MIMSFAGKVLCRLVAGLPQGSSAFSGFKESIND